MTQATSQSIGLGVRLYIIASKVAPHRARAIHETYRMWRIGDGYPIAAGELETYMDELLDLIEKEVQRP